MPETRRFKVTKDLENWLPEMETRYADCFPRAGGGSYATRYIQLAEFLNEHVHPEVERGALLEDLLKQVAAEKVSYERVTYLNNHGPAHVKSVIVRASDLLRELGIAISPYEAYLLLAAIHFHDVGNIYGRDEHERKCWEVMSSPELCGRLGDTTEQRVIARIASAHGGVTCDGNKDTISLLQEEDERYGQEIRPRFLASVLRFADELADDRTRASRFLLHEGKIPAASELFHAYSFSLHSVLVKKAEVRLSYEINLVNATRTYTKPDQDAPVYLLDEIYSRVRKMHRERMYCMRFWPTNERPVIRVRGRVEALRMPAGAPDAPPNVSYAMQEWNITFSMEEEGYPGGNPQGACVLCIGPKQDLPTGEQLHAWAEHRDESGDNK